MSATIELTPVDHFITTVESPDSADRSPYSKEAHPLSLAAQNLIFYNQISSDVDILLPFNRHFYAQDLSAMERDLANQMKTLPTDGKIIPWLSQASHYETTIFSGWYQNRQREFQSAIDRDKAELQDYAMTGFNALAKVKLSSYATMNNLNAAIRVKDTIIAKGSLQLPNHYTAKYNGNNIFISNSYSNPMNFTGVGAVLSRSILHEYGHLFSRSTMMVNEVGAEHMSTVAFAYLSGSDPKPEQLQPSLRDERASSHENERELIGLIMNEANIPTTQLIHTQTSNNAGIAQAFESQLQLAATRITRSHDFLSRQFSNYNDPSPQTILQVVQALSELRTHIDPVTYPKDEVALAPSINYFS